MVSKQTVIRMFALLGLSSLAGLLANFCGPRLPICSPYVSYQRAVIHLPVARQLQKSKVAIFVDVRSNSKMTIPQALRLPSGRPDEQTLAQLQASPDVICFGEDDNDENAVERIAQLQSMGVTRIVLLAEGWRGWKAAGYPEEL